jgi:hypothetical protein
MYLPPLNTNLLVPKMPESSWVHHQNHLVSLRHKLHFFISDGPQVSPIVLDPQTYQQSMFGCFVAMPLFTHLLCEPIGFTYRLRDGDWEQGAMWWRWYALGLKPNCFGFG